MTIITFANNKGGSAKTTTTTIVGHGLAMMMKNSGFENSKVLVIDTDSQSHSTLLLTGRKDFREDETLIRVLHTQRQGGDVRAALDDTIIQSNWDENLYILPASVGLDNTEESLVGQDGNVFYLKRILKHVQSKFPVILIDTCPKFSLLTKMSLLASDEVIIPVAPQFLDADGLASMIRKVYDIRAAWEQSNPDVTGVTVVKYSNRVNGHVATLGAIENHPSLGKLFIGMVPINSEIEYSHAAQQSIFAYNPNAKGAIAYAEITRNIASRIFAKV